MSWNDAMKALNDLKAYVQQQNLGEETEIQVHKLAFDLQKIRIEKTTQKKSCQDSIMNYIKK